MASLPDRDLTPAMAKERGDSYRADLDHLSDEQWMFAVGEAKRSLTFFPSIKHLLDFASEFPQPVRHIVAAKCEDCEGTGWEYVQMDQRSDGQPIKHFAVRRCRCRPVPVSA